MSPKQSKQTSNHAGTATAEDSARLLTFDELAAAVPFSKSTLRRLIARGVIPKFQPGGRRHRVAFHPDVLNALPGDDTAATGPAPAKADTHKPRGLPGPQPRWARRFPLPSSLGDQ